VELLRLSAAEVAELGGPVAAAERLRGLIPAGESVAEQVAEILASVRAGGDEAVLELTSRFDTRGREPAPLLVEPEQLDDAIRRMPLELVAGLQVAIANVAEVADAGAGRDAALELPQGQQLRLREIPVSSAAVYVPGGRAPYPSTVVMGVVTARAAGVIDVAVCAPPGPDGEIDPAVLGTCRLCGVERVYRMGGAQAIAALAYGTQTVKAVDVIVGPGNLYVQEAKRQLSGVVGIDGFAGPSDLLVVLGAACGEREIAFAALDMLAQAEHGSGSLVAAVSPSAEHVASLVSELERRIVELPTVGDAAFAAFAVADAAEAIALANAFAAEHLELIGEDVE
jgi:histidinol dehydrogenase